MKIIISLCPSDSKYFLDILNIKSDVTVQSQISLLLTQHSPMWVFRVEMVVVEDTLSVACVTHLI